MGASLRDGYSLVFVILAVILSLLLVSVKSQQTDNPFRIAIVNEDQGEYSEQLMEDMLDYDGFAAERLPMEAALKLLYRDQVELVLHIRSDFTEKLQTGDFDDILALYFTPSSQAPLAVSEPVLSRTMLLWVEERAVVIAREFADEKGWTFSAVNEAALREELASIVVKEAPVHVATTILGQSETDEEPMNALQSSILNYAMCVVFYLLVGAAWALDINRRVLVKRAAQMGVRRSRLLLGTSLAPFAIAAAGAAVVAALSALLFDISAREAMASLPAFMVFLCGTMGMVLFVSALTRQSVALFFLAPLVTIVNAILCGMLAELPEYAGMLETVSFALPGRWLNTWMTGTAGSVWLPAILCSAVWLAIGILVHPNKGKSYTRKAKALESSRES
jgi:ABC-type multidrug transport system permease subunit